MFFGLVSQMLLSHNLKLCNAVPAKKHGWHLLVNENCKKCTTVLLIDLPCGAAANLKNRLGERALRLRV